MRRRACLVLACAALLGGCGEEDARRALESAREQAQALRERVDDYRRRADEIGRDAQRIRERVRRRVEAALDDLRQAVPAASLAPPRSGARQGENAIERFLTETLRSIDRYWTRTLTQAGRSEPRVRYLWVSPGRLARSGCGERADDSAAFYCPMDDTIYIGQRFASELWRGVGRTFPGEAAGRGRAVGDFGLAYVVAHEYGHNLQQELGYFAAARGGGIAKPFELQADCFAGAWGNAVYREGQVTEEDVREALSTAMAAGDFEFDSQEHHGTPEERRDAWLLGWSSGDPSECGRFVAV